ncbi:MAG: hypothetical protein DDT19_00098 [Syntrophomonadaceae bacterium]|nr:hypothetical protein [Bacillota bacterium]
MGNLTLEAGETLICKPGSKIEVQPGAVINLYGTNSENLDDGARLHILPGARIQLHPGKFARIGPWGQPTTSPAMQIPVGAVIWGAVGNVNSFWPDWHLGSAAPGPNVNHCLRIDVNSDYAGSSGIEIEKHGRAGYGIAIRIYSDNPRNPMLPKGIGIDIQRRATGLMIRKWRDANSIPGGQCIRVEDKGGVDAIVELYSSSGASARLSFVEAKGGRWLFACQPDSNLVLYDRNMKPKGVWRP